MIFPLSAEFHLWWATSSNILGSSFWHDKIKVSWESQCHKSACKKLAIGKCKWAYRERSASPSLTVIWRIQISPCMLMFGHPYCPANALFNADEPATVHVVIPSVVLFHGARDQMCWFSNKLKLKAPNASTVQSNSVGSRRQQKNVSFCSSRFG